MADDLHALGLGFGMYSDAGKYTCGGYAGSLGYEIMDANTFAGWGVDYLKVCVVFFWCSVVTLRRALQICLQSWLERLTLKF